MARQIDRALLKDIKKHEEKPAPRDAWFLQECFEWKKKHKTKIFLEDHQLPIWMQSVDEGSSR